MKKTAVVYWSSTGNTEAMAQAVLEGMKEAGAEAVLLTPDAVDVGALAGMDAIAFGCPAMGSEVLEEMRVRAHVLRLQEPSGRQERGPVRLLRLGRRSVDA